MTPATVFTLIPGDKLVAKTTRVSVMENRSIYAGHEYTVKAYYPNTHHLYLEEVNGKYDAAKFDLAPVKPFYLPVETEAVVAADFAARLDAAAPLVGVSDPNGKALNEPGAKADHGKPRMSLVLGGFSGALVEVAKVGTFGAKKYTDNGWTSVPNGFQRYDDAQMRHAFARLSGEECDSDSGLMHAAHEAWNALAKLQLILNAKG